MRMRIAILTPTYDSWSGIDRVVEEQARDFMHQGHDVTIFTLSQGLPAPCPVVIMGMSKKLLWQRIYRLFYFFDIRHIIRYGKKLHDFDTIYSHFYPMNILALFARFMYKKNFVFYNHGLPPSHIFTSWREKVYIILFRFFNNHTARYAHRIISVSHFLDRVFYKENGKRGEVQYPPLDQGRFSKQPNPKRVREKHHIQNNPLVLSVGRISPHKGIEYLIQAFLKLQRDIPEAKLIMIGKQTFVHYMEKLKAISDASIFFIESVSDDELIDYYAACNVYATASLWEGFDMPVQEAKFFRKPIVAFDIDVHKELLSQDPESILVSMKNVVLFARALLHALDFSK